MEKMFLSMDDLAIRWDCSKIAIQKMKSSGKLKPSPNVPGIKFHIDYIKQLEDCNSFDKLSPLERKRLETENEKLRKELDNYKQIIADIFKQTSNLVSIK